jgi:hypothetical protein
MLAAKPDDRAVDIPSYGVRAPAHGQSGHFGRVLALAGLECLARAPVFTLNTVSRRTRRPAAEVSCSGRLTQPWIKRS